MHERLSSIRPEKDDFVPLGHATLHPGERGIPGTTNQEPQAVLAAIATANAGTWPSVGTPTSAV